MAYMKRPVLHYQPEGRESYAKSQNWGKGYFDYRTMGFGPVCADRDALFAALEELLRNDCTMPALYADRVDATFPRRDAECCRRVFDAITAASRPFAQGEDGHADG
jgi:CDP-glycerol glycerophosphotransferase (TagB/SpsB family)